VHVTSRGHSLVKKKTSTASITVLDTWRLSRKFVQDFFRNIICRCCHNCFKTIFHLKCHQNICFPTDSQNVPPVFIRVVIPNNSDLTKRAKRAKPPQAFSHFNFTRENYFKAFSRFNSGISFDIYKVINRLCDNDHDHKSRFSWNFWCYSFVTLTLFDWKNKNKTLSQWKKPRVLRGNIACRLNTD